MHVMELSQDGELLDRESRVILDNGRSNFGLAWAQGPSLWTLSDIGGQWNVHLVDHRPGTEDMVAQGLFPAELGEIGEVRFPTLFVYSTVVDQSFFDSTQPRRPILLPKIEHKITYKIIHLN